MNRSLMIKGGLLVLLTVLAGSGCAPMPYQEPYYDDPEVIIIYEPVPVPVPVPYPVPGEIARSEPLPQRHSPLTKPQSQKNPRIKTPRGDRETKPPVVAQGGGSRSTKNPGPRRR